MALRVGIALLLVTFAPLSIPDQVTSGRQGNAVEAALRTRVAESDFNGDGYAELMIGGNVVVEVDGPDGELETTSPGVVHVLHGSERGLLAAHREMWRGADVADASDSEEFGQALAPGDFDGDGNTDLAIGIAAAGDDSSLSPGEVLVIYGSRQGLDRRRTQVWSQDTLGVAGKAEPDDHFGTALAAANFGAGVQDDLAIGVSSDGPGSRGGVNVLYGSPTGLTAAGNQHWSQASAGIPGKARSNEQFGFALAAGHFTARTYADLAIGVPQDQVGRRETAGSVNLLHGSPRGLSARGSQLWNQNSAGVKGRAGDAEFFGNSLAAGHFSGRVATDLAIGVPGDNTYAGGVNVLRGSPKGLSADGDQLWNSRSKGLASTHRSGHFWVGGALATGNFGRDYKGRAYTDLAVSISRGLADSAAVHIMYGSATGLSAKNSQGWTPSSPGIPGRVEPDADEFGHLLAAANFGRDAGDRPYDDLAVGNYFGDQSVTVIYGTSSGLKTGGSQRWTSDRLTPLQSSLFPTTLAAR